MLNLSYWAKKHVFYARILLVFLKLLLAGLAFVLSRLLNAANWQIPELVIGTTVIVFFLVIIFYPDKQVKKINFYRAFVYRKTCDCLLAAVSFVLLTHLFQQGNVNSFYNSNSSAIAAMSTTIKPIEPPSAEQILKSLNEGRDKKTLTHQEKRILKKEFKRQLGVWVKAALKGDKETKRKAGLIILAIIGALGLLALVGLLACNVSCNGADGAAIVIAVLGLAGVIWGLIAVIRRIKRGPKKKTQPEEPVH